MVNVHLNGDIVRCPDIAEIHKKAAELRDKHRICKYNIHENTCPVWLIAVRSHKHCGRCCLACSAECPGHKIRKKTGNMKKQYKIDNATYRKIASASHYMVKESKYKTLFITLTFPQFKKRKYNESEINKSFSRFAHNLHEIYGVKYYIAVKELCPTSGRPHFHMLLSIKFTDFNILNGAWCAAISNICYASKNALRTEKNKIIIRSPDRAMRYACKYFAKCRGSRSNTRIVFLSMPLILKPKNEVISVETILKGYKSIYICQSSDYTTTFRITDQKEFRRFCTLYLYALFELSDNKTDFFGIPGSLN